MANTVEAVYENGVFKPVRSVDLAEGQRVRVLLPVSPVGPVTPERAEEILRQTQALYEGLTEEEIAAVEGIVLERCHSRDGSKE